MSDQQMIYDLSRQFRTNNTEISLFHERLRNEYTDFELIGEGTMTKVYAARSIQDNHAYAVKVLNTKSIAYIKSPRRCWDLFIKETLQLSKFSHSNIMPILNYDFDSENEQAFYVMPLLKNLRELNIERREVKTPRKFDQFSIDKLIQDSAKALNYVYQSFGAPHDNLKLENVFLTLNGDFIVSDFRGFPYKRLAIQNEKENWKRNIYQPPELASSPSNRNQKIPGSPSDVFALGIIAVEALGINWGSFETLNLIPDKLDYELARKEIVDLAKIKGVDQETIAKLHQMLALDPYERIALSELYDDISEVDFAKKFVLRQLMKNWSTRQAVLFERWRKNVEKQKLLEKGITFAKIIIQSLNNRDHLLREALFRWRDNTTLIVMEGRQNQTQWMLASERGFEKLQSIYNRVISTAYLRLKLFVEYKKIIKLNTNQRKTLLVYKRSQNFIKDAINQWRINSKRSLIYPAYLSAVQSSSSLLFQTIQRILDRRQREVFSNLVSFANRRRVLSICLNRMNEVIKYKFQYCMETWRTQCTYKIFSSAHNIVQLDNVLGNYVRGLLMSAFHRIRVTGITEYHKSYITAIWKWKFASLEARYYIKQEVFMKRSRALAKLLFILDTRQKELFKWSYDNLYNYQLKERGDLRVRCNYLALILNKHLRRSFNEFKVRLGGFETEPVERDDNRLERGLESFAKTMARIENRVKYTGFGGFKEYAQEQQHCEDKLRIVSKLHERAQKTKGLGLLKTLILRREKKNKQQLHGWIVVKALINYRLHLGRAALRLIRLFAESKKGLTITDLTQKGKALYSILRKYQQIYKRACFQELIFNMNLHIQRQKILAINRIIRKKKMFELMKIYKYFTFWRNEARNYNPWFKRSVQIAAKNSRINLQIAYWRLRDSINVAGASLSNLKADKCRRIFNYMSKHYHVALARAFWTLQNYGRFDSSITPGQTFLNESSHDKSRLGFSPLIHRLPSNILSLERSFDGKPADSRSIFSRHFAEADKAKLQAFCAILSRHYPQELFLREAFNTWKALVFGEEKFVRRGQHSGRILKQISTQPTIDMTNNSTRETFLGQTQYVNPSS